MGIRQGGNNQEENQNRSHGLQRANEQAAKNGDACDGRSTIMFGKMTPEQRQ